MPTLLQADIFFFISSIGVVLVTIAVIVAAYHVVKVTREIRALIHSVRGEVELFRAQRRKLFLRARFFKKWASNFVSEMAGGRGKRSGY